MKPFKLFLDIVRSRALLIFLTLAVTVAAAGALTYLATTKYSGTTSLVLNFDGRNPLDMQGTTATRPSSRPLISRPSSTSSAARKWR